MNFPNGRFTWFEYMAPDTKKAQGFYGELFGWKAQSVSGQRPYEVLMLGNDRIGGLAPTAEGAPKVGHWLPHLQVEDVNASVAKLKSLGGKVRKEPTKMSEWGTFSIVADPTDATFVLWQPTQPQPFEYKGTPGNWCWVELATDNPDKAVSFYSQIGGFVDDPQNMGPEGTYHILKAGNKGRAGVMKKMSPQQPNAWLPYVHVASADQSSDKAKRLGANVAVPPTDIPNIGRFSVIIDPQGGGLGILQPAPGM